MTANLPILRHQIALGEEDGFITLDVTDETGGLGIKLYLAPHMAADLGMKMADKARFHASKEADDPARTKIELFDSQQRWIGGNRR